MGMIYKRGEVFWIKYYCAGKPIRESTGTTKQEETERFLKNREGRVAIGAPALPRLERIRFAEIADALIEHYRVTGDRQLRDVQVKPKPVWACFDNHRLGSHRSSESHRVYRDTPSRWPVQRPYQSGTRTAGKGAAAG